MANFQMGEDLTTYDIDSILSSLGSGPSVENTSNEALLQTFFTSDVLQTPSPESSPFQAFAATPTSDDHSSFNERSDSSGDELAGFEQVSPNFNFNFGMGPDEGQKNGFHSMNFPEVSSEGSNNSSPTAKGTKRKNRKSSEKSPDSSASNKIPELGEAQLLELDSKEMEEYMKKLCSSRTLAPSEEKHLKKIRRLIKNREYAQSSRDKRKKLLEVLQVDLNQHKEEITRLKTRNQQLETENAALRTQMSKLSLLLRTDPVIRERMTMKAKPSKQQPEPTVTQAPSETIEVNFSDLQSTEGAPLSTSSNFDTKGASSFFSAFSIGNTALPTVPTLGVSLFVVLFSFALFFGFPQQMGTPGTGLSVQSNANVPLGTNYYYTGRSLLESAQKLAFGEIEAKQWVDALPLPIKDFLIRHNLYVSPPDPTTDNNLINQTELSTTSEDSRCPVSSDKGNKSPFSSQCPYVK